MKTKSLKMSVIVWTGLAVLLFQNFDLPHNRLGLFVQTVDQDSRNEHAAELLGHSFKGSKAQNVDETNLHYGIFAEFKRRLPKAEKWQAAPLANLVIQESRKYGLDPVFIMAVIAQESSFRPNARGPVGEIGLMQLRPETAACVAKRIGLPFHGAHTLNQPYVNLKLGIAYISHLRAGFKGQANQYVSAYNMGARKVRRLIANSKTPKEYSGKVMKKYQELYTNLTKTGTLLAKNQTAIAQK
jgi:soluble lytic murein transglycosylase